MNEQEKRDRVIRAVARLIEGLGVPISLGMPLGKAVDAYKDVRGEIDAFGWQTADEIELLLRRAISGSDEVIA